MDNDILFFIKFGKKDHLQQIVDGKVRFSPSQYYIELEKTQNNKGQGDLLEGKMKIRCISAKLYHPDTNQYIGELKNVIITLAIQDVNNIPIFCLSAGNKSHCIDYYSSGKFKIKFNKKQIDTVFQDFPNADSALIIPQPERFINDISSKYSCISNLIKYYNYDILTTDMLCTVLNIDEIMPNIKYPLTFDNKYRHLLCKDISFINQNEYRFILLDEYIKKPKFYDIYFSSSYIIVNLNELFNGISINEV
jgi:hypothetical protein